MRENFEFLKPLYDSNRLAHFYHFKALHRTSEFIMSQLLIDWFKSIGIKNPTDHSDLLWIGYQNETTNYHVDSIKEVYKFQDYRPLSLKTKFLIITNAQKITDIIANKLLKTLEEPAHFTTIILLNPNSAELLPTVQSRALNMTLNLHEHDEDILLFKEISLKIQNGLNLHEFIDQYKKTPEIDLKILKGILNKKELYRSEKILILTKSIEEARTYHSAVSTRLTHLYYFLNP